MSSSGLFVTVLYGVLDLSAGSFAYARAGLDLPILCRAGGILQSIPQSNGMLMGIFPEITIDEQVIDLFPGDVLLLFSDGASDATNPREEMFGRDHLAQALIACTAAHAQETCDCLLSAILDHQHHSPQFDDITLVTIRANPG